MLRVGVRGSQLALAYAEKVCNLLPCETEIVIIKTDGDIYTDVPIHSIGGKAVFCTAIEKELLNNNIDCAVHSLKDMPGVDTPGLVVNAVVERNSTRDVLIGKVFDGCVIGTSSPRRKSQILDLYADINVTIKDIRGNVDTRLNKLDNGDYDAIVLAEAGLQSLEINREWIALPIIPAVGQGIIAIQTRADDTQTNSIVKSINHELTFAHARVERAFLKGMGGDCHTKLAGIATGFNPIRFEAVYYE